MPLEALFNAPKELARFPVWIGPEDNTGYLWIDAPISIQGVVEAGLTFRGGAFAHLQDQHVVFQLLASKPGSLRRIPLARIEWKSIRGGHQNKRRGTTQWRGRRVGATHIHSFELNWLPTERRMLSGNLPMACDPDEDLQSFEMLRGYTGKLFRISNIDLVSPPPWAYSLFDHG